LRQALPTVEEPGMEARVVVGRFGGAASPVVTQSETVFVDVTLAAGATLKIPADAEERAVYILDGTIAISGDRFRPDRLLVFRPGDEIVVETENGAHFMLFGGASLGSPRYIWWNFVSSSKERIEQAKEEWKTGRFDIVPGDDKEFIPLPEN
jgi:redox-sensitive bicupin YhaK (pirin superfamily)